MWWARTLKAIIMSGDYSDIAKNNIKHLVNAYKMAFPDECRAVIEQVKQKRTANYKATGDIRKLKSTEMVERPIHEISETLFTILHRRLTEEELAWFGSNQGARWFAKTFPEFSRVDRV